MASSRGRRPSFLSLVEKQTGPETIGGGGENLTLAAMHEQSFHGVAIVVAHEMQHTVRHEQLELFAERNPDTPSLAISGIHRDHDLSHVAAPAERLHGKREDVRPAADATPDGIQPADFHVVDHEDVDVGARPSQRGQGPISRPGEAPSGERTAVVAVDDDARH